MSLLDKASLVQIPSGYGDGKLYSVVPDNGDGDFDFSRSSSGTRVNSEGLIEVASVLGSELITNGDFATDSDWNKETGWTISGGNLVGTSVTTGLAYQNSIVEAGKKYKATFDVVVTSGVIGLYFDGGTGYQGLTTTTQTVTVFFTAVTASPLYFRSSASNFTGTIDNVSVKEVFENDVPRLDYSGGASCASLLLEPQRTNVLVHSTIFYSGWSLDDATKVSDSTTSPDGTTNAITLIGNTNASRHNIAQGPGGAVTASLSVFAKAKELRYLQIASANNPSQYVNFDVSDGTVGTVGSNFSDAKIEDYGNGWYRCSVTSTNQYNAMYISLVSSLTSSWLESWTMSNNTDGLYLYGAQLEEGSYPTSYIPTTSSTVTRTADVCNNAGTSATFNSTEGVLFAEIAALADDSTQRFISLGDGTSNNRIILGYNNASNGIIFFIRVGGTLVANILTTINDIKNYNKLAVKWKENDFALWGNGVELGSDLSGVSFASGVLDNLNFLDADGTTEPFYGKTKQLIYFDEALSDEELLDLTGQANLSFNNLATFYNYTIL